MFKWLNEIFRFNAEALPTDVNKKPASFDPGEILTGIPSPEKEKWIAEAEAKAKAAKTEKAKKHTKTSLNKLTKLQLEELGRAEFDIELDRRKKKDTLITELLAAQKQKN